MDKAAFEKIIYDNWAAHFHSSLDTIHQPGTTILTEEKFSDDKEVALWHVGKHTFVQLYPALLSVLEQILAHLPTDASLSADDFERGVGLAQIKSRSSGPALYLFPSDLPDYIPPARFTLRQLTLADAQALQHMKAFCASEDVNEAYVEVEHEIAFGCFEGEQLVAIASGYDRTGFMDIGVLTHPDFRQKGLGRAVIGALCEWSLGKSIIPQYRYDNENIRSAYMARSLNFRAYVSSEAFWMK